MPKRTRGSESDEFRLLKYSASGRHDKVERLIKKHPDIDLNSRNLDGETALHLVLFLIY